MSLSGGASPPPLDEPQLPTRDQTGIEETKVISEDGVNSVHKRALQQLAPRAGDPPGT